MLTQPFGAFFFNVSVVMEKTLYVVLGPTAVGKTTLSLRLAEHLNCPILSADSRQMFRDLPIGTAAPTPQELARVPHYFVGQLPLEAYYSAAQYEKEALQLCADWFTTHSSLVVSGGSMLYLDALCRGIDEIPTTSLEVRREVQHRYATEGAAVLLEELRLLDPVYYAQVDPYNHKRIIHALEVIHQSGQPFSAFRTGQVKERPFRIVKIGLQRPREELFERINQRTTTMIEAGWLEEARRVLPFRTYNSLNTVGYKELFHYLDGDWELDFALERIRKNTRVYAKKQMTWFTKDPSIRWFHPDRCDDLSSLLCLAQ